MVNTENLEQKQARHRNTLRTIGARSGQALVEYALILILVAVAAGVTLAATGPAMANIFSNVLFNVIGQDPSSIIPLNQAQAAAFWQTVEFIRNNPQQETPYPTPIDLPERSEEPSGGSVNTNTYTYTYTPSNTYTRTPTYTPSPTDTYTPGAPPTPDDFAFDVPHADLSDKPEWWRLDNVFGIGDGLWNVTYYTGDNFDGTGHPWAEYLASNGFINNVWSGAGPANAPSNVIGFPPGITDFSAIYSKSFYVAHPNDPVDINFIIDVSDSLEIAVDGVSIGAGVYTSSGSIPGHIFDTGIHTLEIKYRDISAHAQLIVNMARQRTNPENTSSTCAWLNIGSDPHSNSPTSVWDEDGNATPASWPAGQTCILELRGYVDLSGVTTPRLSWWDVWDFMGNSGVTAELQIANYVTNPEGFFDRAAASWQSLGVRSGNSANYNWTRNQVDLSSLGLSNLVTFRFRLTSSTTGNARWNIDDLQVLSDPAAPAFTVGNTWTMDDRGQMADFIFNADANYTRSVIGGDVEGYRWDVTGTNARSGTGWDGSPGGSFPQTLGAGAGSNQNRITYLEFRNPINLAIAPGTDTDGDTGVPILSFWQAYDIAAGSSLAVQYTHDPINDNSGTPDNWVTIPNEGLLLNSAGSTPPPGTELNDAGTTRTNLTMHSVEIHLTQIPSAMTQPFRLRFALTSAPSATANDWYLDDVRIEREDLLVYEPYPMLDNAENAVAAAKRWSAVGPSGVWTTTTPAGGGYRSTVKAFADSPGGNYPIEQTTAMEMQRTLDLLHDTPDNTAPIGEGPRPAAISPILSFMWRGDIEGIDVLVDVWVARTNQWRQIWTYDPGATRRQQNAWERVEINLQQATADSLIAATGSPWTWNDITSNPCDSGGNLQGCLDDDIRVRIRLNTAGGTARDGIYVDNIRIGESESYDHKLWGATPCGTCTGITDAGDFDLVDDIESRLPNLGAANDSWIERWFAGGSWDPTNALAARTGAYSMTESPSGNYSGNALIYLEFKPIIDLRGTDPAFVPSLDFFTRYSVANGDALSVQIATENTGDTTQGYNKLAGWNSWTNVAVSQPGTPTRIDTWFLSRVNLSSYIGERIRIRFVLTTDGGTEADGQYIDAVKVSTGLSTLPHALGYIFEDYFSYAPYWIFDGNWGQTQQYVSANNSDSWYLGAPWDGFFYNCDGCNATSFYDGLNTNEPAGLALDDLSPLTTNLMPDTPSYDVVEWLGTGRPQPQPGYGSGYVPGAEWNETWAGRWVRDVTLTAGQTYRVYAIADDGVLLEVDDPTDLTGVSPSGVIINDWGDHGARLTYTTFTVAGGSDLNRTFRLSYYDNTIDAVLSLNIISASAYSVTDSPNTPGGSGGQGDNALGYTTVASTNYGYSSIMLNGMIDLTGTTNPQFVYDRYYNLTANTNLALQFSSDGGFTWADVNTLNGPNSRLPTQNWETQVVSIPPAYQTTRFTFRFRFDTRTAAAGAMGDSIWIGSVIISDT